MMSTVEGKIDGDAMRDISGDGEYERTGETLNGDAWICGRTTMQQHFADGTFVAKSKKPAGPQAPFVAKRAESYAICVDTRGTLLWNGGDLDGDHLICILSEQAADDYLADLRRKQISYIVAGRESVDLAGALEQLGDKFAIRTLLLEGGGHINGGFLEAGLVDELSLLIAPGIDGRHEIAAVFDGVDPARTRAVPLALKSVERRDRDILWLRYEVVRS
jgi:riboflavin biosynthesis pyrimidine reductase